MKIVIEIMDKFVSVKETNSCVDSVFFEKMSSHVTPATARLA
jgi:hypothetical protein